MITEYLIHKALNAAVDIAKKMSKESDLKTGISREDISESINFHIQLIRNWSDEVSFSDLKESVTTKAQQKAENANGADNAEAKSAILLAFWQK